MVDAVNSALIVVASAAFVATIYFTYELSEETRGGRYWVAFLLAAVGLGAHEWLKLVDAVIAVDPETWTLARETGIVIGAVALAYGSYGLRQSVRTVKQQLAGSDDG